MHILVIFIIPLIILRGCMEAPYGIPKGSGDTIVQLETLPAEADATAVPTESAIFAPSMMPGSICMLFSFPHPPCGRL